MIDDHNSINANRQKMCIAYCMAQVVYDDGECTNQEEDEEIIIPVINLPKTSMSASLSSYVDMILDENCSIGHVRYYTTASDLWFSVNGGNEYHIPQNGFVDIKTDGIAYPTTRNETITRVDVLAYGNKTSWNRLCIDCVNMTSFNVTPCDIPTITDYSYAFQNCTSLTSFPLIDTNLGTNFNYTWNNCTGLTSFPQLDMSNAVYLGSTWRECEFNSFPSMDLSSATNSTFTWYGNPNITELNSITFGPALNSSSASNNMIGYCSSFNQIVNCISTTDYFALDAICGAYNASINYGTILEEINGCDFSSLILLDESSTTVAFFSGCRNLKRIIDCDFSGITTLDGFSNSNDFPVWVEEYIGNDLSNVSSARQSWYAQVNLKKFSNNDLSNCTNFFGSWGSNSGLIEFEGNNMISATTVESAWQSNYALASFGTMTLSLCMNFTNAWRSCSNLPHCPGGNEIIIPSGAVTTNMCLGI